MRPSALRINTIALLLLALAACGRQVGVAPASTPTAVKVLSGAANCLPPSTLTAQDGGLEIPAISEGGTVWALIEGPAVTQRNPPKVVAERPVKVIWRVTGSGDITVVAVDQSGVSLTLDSQRHSGSDWNRPGDQWGSSITFPHPGCWQLVATRGPVRGTVWLVVDSAQRVSS